MISLSSIWQYVDSVIHTPKPNGGSLLERQQIAPDYNEPEWLKRMEDEENLVFFYGGSILVPQSLAFTEEKFSLWNHNETGTAIAVAGAFKCKTKATKYPGKPKYLDGHELQGIPREKIKGELHVVKKNALNDLDLEMSNEVFFHRRRVAVRIPLLNSEGDHARLNAWMYVASPYIRRNIIWDANYYASTGGFVYSREPVVEDRQERWIGRYYQHQPVIANGKDNRCFLYFHRGLNESVPAPELKPQHILQQPAEERGPTIWRTHTLDVSIPSHIEFASGKRK